MKKSIAVLILLAVALVSANEIKISPNYQVVKGSCSISIMLYPSEPIKGWEFKLSFDPTKLQATNVSEGNIFSSYETWFTPNYIIDNNNGTITKLYGLILGQGNVTNHGSLIEVTFDILDVEGISTIEILDEGICNETQYVSSDVYNAEIQVYYNLPPWDINKDGRVNIRDISILVGHYNELCSPGDPWDVRIDGIVDALDISLVVVHYEPGWTFDPTK